jgi:uncharacterized alkaline shock family protein YloU
VSTGIITTIAGSSTSGSFSGDNSQATSAGLNLPTGIALDSTGSFISPFYWDIALLTPSTLGNVYFADYNNNRIRKVAVSTGIITTIAGTGTTTFNGDGGAATSATLHIPYGVVLDSAGNNHYIYIRSQRNSLFHYTTPGNVYIADFGHHRIRKVTISTGIITTVAGTGTSSYSGDNGPATNAALYGPTGVSLDASGNYSFIVIIVSNCM